MPIQHPGIDERNYGPQGRAAVRRQNATDRARERATERDRHSLRNTPANGGTRQSAEGTSRSVESRRSRA
jgi:hypothetical protein